MTREDVLKMQTYKLFEHDKELYVSRDDVLKALQTEPCEDAISRQAVMDTIYRECSLVNLDIDFAKVLLLQRKIKALQPVQPQQKTGHWEYVQYDGNLKIGNWHCSECNRIVFGVIRSGNPAYIYKFCPECGAKMEGSESNRMDDLTIIQIHEWIDSMRDYTMSSGFQESLDELSSMVEKLESNKEQKVDGWIPCSERLPEEEGWYLVSLSNKYGIEIDMRMWTENGWLLFGNEENENKILAWIPLPEPYKAESEDKE